MQVVNRSGECEPVHFDKIQNRISSLAFGLSNVEPVLVSQKTIEGLADKMTTRELDDLASETSASLATIHPEYAILAARICLSDLKKMAPASFSECVKQSIGLSSDAIAFVMRHKDTLDNHIVNDRDERYDFFAIRTLLRAYLRGDGTRVVETPQYMNMRIAVGIHCASDDIDATLKTYDLLSCGFASHATPTMFNAATCEAQMASCFLMTIPADSIQAIFQANTWCALISKTAGGIGVNVTDIRARGSRIAGSGGVSNGIVPMLKCFDSTARYVDQGGGKRKGAIAAYLEPWHADIFAFLELKKPNGKDELRARDLFYALWVPDIFMRRVDADEDWSLFCPNTCPDLTKLYGAKFEAAYVKAETDGLARRQVKARAIWSAIIDSQIESGGPYILFKDAANNKNNQKHLGPLRCSNLCTEIFEYVSPDEVAVCNLASVALPSCVHDGAFDFAILISTVKQLVRNLNRIIDNSFYPIEEARRSNMTHRPIGIGVQGLADVFNELFIAFDSEEAMKLNKNIFETMYFAALSESITIAAELGKTYASYEGSPLSQGLLMPDLWGVSLTNARHDWSDLRRRLAAHGAINSLLLAPMPTASTAHILGNTEAFEPITSLIYVRRVLAGDFVCVNKNLVSALTSRGIWNVDIKNQIVAAEGSIQNIDIIPDDVKAVFKTAYELKQRTVIDMAADRAPFICQGQSMNLFFADVSYKKLTAALMHAWRRGLKNGVYYCRIRPSSSAAKVTVDVCQPGCTSCSA